MIQKFRNSRTAKIFAIACMMSFLHQIFYPVYVNALTSGPTQPEVHGFEPVGTNQMVDLFTGDFTYNIPLFELPGPNGGYPFNLAYHSGIGMDQEASWVGLGWSLTPGAINRNVRGIPDDFNEDHITEKLDMETNWTVGVTFGAGLELFGAESLLRDLTSANVSLNIYYNSYKGFGYGTGFGVHYHKSGTTGGLGLSLNTDSQGGASLNLDANASFANSKASGSYGLGIGLHSQRGLKLTEEGSINVSKRGMKSTNSISFAETSWYPSISHDMRGFDMSGTVKTGLSVFGSFTNLSIGGFYNRQAVKNKDKNVNVDAYGYMYLHEAPYSVEEARYVLDFMREKEHVVHKESRNLAIPCLTYDMYSISGQGTGGMFRPYRSEIGHVHDMYMHTKTSGGSFGLEIGAGAGGHFGAEGSYSESFSKNMDWDEDNKMNNEFVFDDQAGTSTDYEPWYFKVHGEPTTFETNEMDYIGGMNPVEFDVDKHGELSSGLHYDGGTEVSNYGNVRDKRMPRNKLIQHYTNKQLKTGLLKEFDINYFEKSANPKNDDPVNYTRTGKNHHIGGIAVINNDGNRYVYGLPAYNNTKEEALFSVDIKESGNNKNSWGASEIEASIDDYKKGTKRYYKKISTTDQKYAYSYLLTAIIGPDYVDVTGNGITDDDYGYWVKFTYHKREADYKWRAPYKSEEVNYIPGMRSYVDDDKGSYTEGTKEIWYLARAETKTHLAKFHTSPRTDGIGADNHGKQYQLDKIELWSKKPNASGRYVEGNILKTVNFRYTNELCSDIYNSSSGEGKLTLRELWFTYQGSSRGELSPYVFSYNADRKFQYHTNRYDRWGNYRDHNQLLEGNATDAELLNRDFPYVNQFNEYQTPHKDSKTDHKALIDEWASAWHLTKIQMPSGGIMEIEFESDDYAYVQHKRAAQMFKIQSIGCELNEYWNKHDWDRNSPGGDEAERTIYFNLETPLPDSYSTDQLKQVIWNDYLSGLQNNNGEIELYYRIYGEIRDQVKDYISGYATLDLSSGAYGVNTNQKVTIDDTEYYTQGFCRLKKEKVKNNYYHPFALTAWQFMRTNRPDLIIETPNIIKNQDGATDNKGTMKQIIKNLANVFNQVKSIFQSFTSECFQHEWANRFDPVYSWIRLTSPDQIKYGGGSRVKRLLMSDQWQEMTGGPSAQYGQVYDYTKVENGKVISSGVASYEPMIGADENPLRHAKSYTHTVPFDSPEKMYFEYPTNESQFPAPVVGYSKVTVQSLGNDKVRKGEGSTSTGITVHEFYTAKDFPVIVKETNINSKPYDLIIPIPLIGSITEHNITASQGYSVCLNDMHGKPKSVQQFAVDKFGNKKAGEALSYVKYFYKANNNARYDNTTISRLNNTVDVITSYDPVQNTTTGKYDMPVKEKLMGVEYEFYTDMRHSVTSNVQGGLYFNTDVLPVGFIPIPVPVPWPIVYENSNTLKTAVTNKIIHQSGILIKEEIKNQGSVIHKEYEVFDEKTGRPVLTSVTNEYEEKIYNFSIPAYSQYPGMGQAYQNIGLSLSAASVTEFDAGHQIYEIQFNEDISGILLPGDQFMIDNTMMATYVSEHNSNGTYLFKSPDDITGTTTYHLVYSGYKNMLNAGCGNIQTLNDNPLENLTPFTETIHFD